MTEHYLSSNKSLNIVLFNYKKNNNNRLGLFIDLVRHFAVVPLRHFVAGFWVHSLLTAGKKEEQDVNPCRNKTVVGCLVKFFVDFWHGVIAFSPFFCFKGNVFKESHTVNFIENPQQSLQKKKYIYIIMDVMILFVGGRKSQQQMVWWKIYIL